MNVYLQYEFDMLIKMKNLTVNIVLPVHDHFANL